jgi:hypothetical protein
VPKFMQFVVIAFLLFYVFNNPEQAGNLVSQAFNAVATFLNSLSS